MSSLPRWKLPPGVSPGLWDYLAGPATAKRYDEYLANTPLLEADLRFVERFFTNRGRLIDLGCGTGRLLPPFARRGFEVLGVDLSHEMLEVAREKALMAGLSVPLIRANLVELDCVADASFDYAACLFSTLGMISGRHHRQAVLEHASRILKPGGLLVVHVHNVGFHVWTRPGRRWLARDAWKRLSGKGDFGDFEMPPHDGIAGLALHHFSRREAITELRRAGFQVLRVESVSHRADCRLPFPAWLACFRAYGYLILCRR